MTDSKKTEDEFRDEEYSNWASVTEYAVWTIRLLDGTKELIRIAPKVYDFIKVLATNVQSVVATVNPAYAATTVYFTAVVALTYSYSVEAQQQLLKAQFKNDDLKLIMDTEIIPILKLLERLHSKGDMKSFCRAKNEIQDLFGKALTSLQAVRRDIEQKILDSTSGATKNTAFLLLSAGGGVASIAALARAPYLDIGFLACPQAIAGSAFLVSSLVGVLGFGYNKLTHEETMSLLNVARLEALEAERLSKTAHIEAKIMCIEYPTFSEKLLKSLGVYMSKMPTTDRLQLKDGESNEL